MARQVTDVRLAATVLVLMACRGPRVSGVSPSPSSIDVRLQTDEADAAIAIVNAEFSRAPLPATAWTTLFASQGYQHLRERESRFGRPFTDAVFAAFLRSESEVAKAPVLDSTLRALKQASVTSAATRALGYLPSRTTLRAVLYLEIKPITNSFVFTGADSVPSIFLYVEPHATAAQVENTLAHELHHIGLSAACHDATTGGQSPAERMLLRFLSAFGEGEAMLAAAGSPSVNPHLADDDTVQRRWDRDVANAPAHIRELSSFVAAVVDHSLASPDSVQNRGMTYFGVQGPWYTVGWLMASTVERSLGRQKLIDLLCEPTALIAAYNDVALRSPDHRLPAWDPALVRRLLELRGAP